MQSFPFSPYAAGVLFTASMRDSPTKLKGSLAQLLQHAPTQAILVNFTTCDVMSTFLHHNKFIAVFIIAVASLSIEGRDYHEINTPGNLAGRRI
jgi:hypothetical protein